MPQSRYVRSTTQELAATFPRQGSCEGVILNSTVQRLRLRSCISAHRTPLHCQFIFEGKLRLKVGLSVRAVA